MAKKVTDFEVSDAAPNADFARIIGLEIHGYKRIELFELDEVDPNWVVIGGANAQGKSSVLDAIEAVLKGGTQADEPVHRGARKSYIVAKTDQWIATRTFDAKGKSSLNLERPDHEPIRQPQKFLDDFLNAIGFDPVAFMDKKPIEQVEILRSITGLDFTEQDKQRAIHFEKRRIAKVEIGRLEGVLSGLMRYKLDSDEEIDVSAESARFNEAQALRQKRQRAELDLEAMNHSLDSLSAEIVELKRRLKEKEELKVDKIKERNAAATALDKMEAMPDTDAMIAKINNAAEHNKKLASNRQYEQTRADLEEKESERDFHHTKLETIEEAKRKALAEAPFPVPGLTFDDAQVLYNGIPFTQSSQAEQLRVCVAVAVALNPKLRVILVRTGSLLDEKNMKLLHKLAVEYKCQVWIERVGDNDAGAIIMEDGRVAN